jgi:hypothetical protein
MVSLSRLKIPSEGMASDPSTGDTFMMNQSGVYIVKALQTGQDQDRIVGMMVAEYQLSREDAERDLADFNGRLRNFGLL